MRNTRRRREDNHRVEVKPQSKVRGAIDACHNSKAFRPSTMLSACVMKAALYPPLIRIGGALPIARRKELLNFLSSTQLRRLAVELSGYHGDKRKWARPARTETRLDEHAQVETEERKLATRTWPTPLAEPRRKLSENFSPKSHLLTDTREENYEQRNVFFIHDPGHMHAHSQPEESARAQRAEENQENFQSFSVSHSRLPLTEREVKIVLCSLAIRTHRDCKKEKIRHKVKNTNWAFNRSQSVINRK